MVRIEKMEDRHTLTANDNKPIGKMNDIDILTARWRR